MAFTRLRNLVIIITSVMAIFVASKTVFIAPEKSVSGLAEESVPSQASPNSELATRIDDLIQQNEYSSARCGISVVSLDGAPLYERNADQLFTPASNMKIYTTAVALELLGGDYRWRTSVYSAAEPSGGVVLGDLVLYGRGAPDLQSSSLEKLADDLFVRGVRKIRGKVIGDESYFRGSNLGDGWQWTDLQWYFGAEASALSVNENEVDVNVTPATKSGSQPEVKANENNGFVTVENRMAADPKASRPTIGVYRGLSNNTVEVWGELTPSSKGFGVRLSVQNPALWAATLFRRALIARGITVEGDAQARTSRVPASQRFDPSRAIELATISSQPLAAIIKDTNKESNNLYAELILRTLGRERRPMLETPEPPGRELGDDEAGTALIRLWLSRTGVDSARLALHDGSGLSRLNLVTPVSATKLLIAIAKSSNGGVFRDSLPIAGRDGTLAGRLKSTGDRVQAKTGSLIYNNALSGYLLNNDGRVYAFAILCNDQTGRASSIRLIDQITSLLVAYPNLPPQTTENPYK